MKTTSYEISKKLYDIGFKGDEYFYWDKEGKTIRLADADSKYPSYDLETILDALPKSVDSSYYSLQIDFDGEYVDGNHAYICYSNIPGLIANEDGVNLEVSWNGNESLADTAARLLILLESKGIVKFNM